MDCRCVCVFVCVCVCVFVFVRRSASSSCRATCHLTNNPPTPTNYHHKGDVVLPLSVAATPRRFRLIRIPWERSKIEVEVTTVVNMHTTRGGGKIIQLLFP